MIFQAKLMSFLPLNKSIPSQSLIRSPSSVAHELMHQENTNFMF